MYSHRLTIATPAAMIAKAMRGYITAATCAGSAAGLPSMPTHLTVPSLLKEMLTPSSSRVPPCFLRVSSALRRFAALSVVCVMSALCKERGAK